MKRQQNDHRVKFFETFFENQVDFNPISIEFGDLFRKLVWFLSL